MMPFLFVLSLMGGQNNRHPVVHITESVFWYGQHGKVDFSKKLKMK